MTTLHEYRGFVFRIDDGTDEPGHTVEFLDLPEIITSGATLVQAFAHACEALDLHLESLQKLGVPAPRPKQTLAIRET